MGRAKALGQESHHPPWFFARHKHWLSASGFFPTTPTWYIEEVPARGGSPAKPSQASRPGPGVKARLALG